MKKVLICGALFVSAGAVRADIVDDFEGYQIGAAPGGIWQDAADYVIDPSNPGPTVSVIDTTNASGNTTRAVQITDGIGTSGGLISAVDHTSTQRFEIDVRLDQRGNGSAPNWMSAVGFFQDTDQTDFNWSPQAVVYASGTGRFRLFVQNADGRGGASRDFGLNGGVWSMDTWYRVALEADTVNGVFDVTITDLESGDVIADASRTYAGWNADFGRYNLISVNDGEYGSNPGTIGNMSSYDNASYVPAPSTLTLLGGAGMLLARRRRA
jgi:hypothetical protein